MRDFSRIKRLPPYVLGIVNDLKYEARKKGDDIIDFGLGNPDMATPNHIVDKLIEAAKKEAKDALQSYWSALDGTIDPEKVDKATDNALIGNAEEVANQIAERFNPEDRIMCWFDFFNHDSERVCRNMKSFMKLVAPHFTK